MLVKVKEAEGQVLDWMVAKCEGIDQEWLIEDNFSHEHSQGGMCYSIAWAQGGPIIERENITLIRANSLYVDGKSIPNWFAETSAWTGHNINTSYEGENFDPCFMVDEESGCYGPTPLIAALRCYAVSKLGPEVDVPDEVLQNQERTIERPERARG